MGLTRINELGVAENKEPPGDPKWRRYANLSVRWLSARSAPVFFAGIPLPPGARALRPVRVIAPTFSRAPRPAGR